MRIPDAGTTQAWVRLLRAHTRALTLVEASLKTANMPPLAWYDVLLELERSGAIGFRPYQLQEKLLLPQYGMSRLLDRIENAGYISRSACDDDGRGQQIIITREGVNIRKQMWRVYGPAIQSAVGDKLSLPEAKKLSDLLGRLLE